MKKRIPFILLCFLGIIYSNCYNEVNFDVMIKVDNQTSQDLHIKFSPNTFKETIFETVIKYKDIDVNKYESVFIVVTARGKKSKYFPVPAIVVSPHPGTQIKKIIISNKNSKELIKEVINEGLFIINTNPDLYTLEITDALLSTEGDEE